MTNYLEDIQSEIAGKVVLELGAGTGLVSLAAIRLGTI